MFVWVARVFYQVNGRVHKEQVYIDIGNNAAFSAFYRLILLRYHLQGSNKECNMPTYGNPFQFLVVTIESWDLS